MNVENTDQSAPRSCTSCGTFFGTQASDWMCSSCYKYNKPHSGQKQLPQKGRNLLSLIFRKKQKYLPYSLSSPRSKSPALTNLDVSNAIRELDFLESNASAQWCFATCIECLNLMSVGQIIGSLESRSCQSSTSQWLLLK